MLVVAFDNSSGTACRASGRRRPAPWLRSRCSSGASGATWTRSARTRSARARAAPPCTSFAPVPRRKTVRPRRVVLAKAVVDRIRLRDEGPQTPRRRHGRDRRLLAHSRLRGDRSKNPAHGGVLPGVGQTGRCIPAGRRARWRRVDVDHGLAGRTSGAKMSVVKKRTGGVVGLAAGREPDRALVAPLASTPSSRKTFMSEPSWLT